MADVKSSPKLILLRHGQSDWNSKNLFTGWVNIPLSKKGVDEAIDAGKRISKIPIDVIYTSTLIRAQMTGMLAMSQHSTEKTARFVDQPGASGSGHDSWNKVHEPKSEANTIAVHYSWHLNERYYGELQGLDKDETRRKYGEAQVKIWRRSYDVPPPNGESLEMTAKRTIPYFDEQIKPHMATHKRNVFIAAHGNSLRSIVMKLDNLTKEQVLELEIPTGQPLCYLLNSNGKFEKVDIDAVQKAYC